MQSKTTFSGIGSFLQQGLMILILFCFVTPLFAQTYVNGNLSTGANTLSGVAAPAGTTWSEAQNVAGNTTVSNTNGGFAGSVFAGLTLADDFVVPVGSSWSVTKLTFYGYQTGAPATPSPFTVLRVQIHSGNPASGPTTIVFGDLTTNRLSASNDASMYRIFNTIAPPPGTAPGTTRKIWTVEANINVTLAPGTYWLEWQTDVSGGAAHFSPPSTVVGVRTVAGYNAQQKDVASGVWTPLEDAGNPATPPSVACDMPFRIDYSTGACTGTPAPGNTLSTADSACPGIPFTLSLQNATPGSGVTYQWQSSPDGITFTNITGATGSTYNTSLNTASTYYQAIVLCAGNPADTSTAVQVVLTPAGGCYCIPGVTDCSLDDAILNVNFGGINNSSDCTTGGYSNYGTSVPAGIAYSNAANPMTVAVGPGGTEYVSVWIDYNHNGQFDAAEFSALGTGNGTTISGIVNIPASALPGVTRMRIRVRFNVSNTPNDACIAYLFGETEDYNVDISPCVIASITAQPADAATTCSNGATFTVASSGTLVTYQWQQRTSASALWTNVVNGVDPVSGATFGGVTSNTLTISNATVLMDGYQYRAIFEGACTATDFSDFATLTVGALAITVDPTSITTCSNNTTPIGIAITSINPSGSAVTDTTAFASGALNIPIPDGVNAGIANTIAVSLPPGAVISAASVTLNVTHTWVGDLVVALKAPNGNVLNLDYGLTQTGGAGPTTGFTNTVISSAGVNTLVSGTDPWTGIFAPDAPTAPGTVPTSPGSLNAGNANVFTFAGLYSVPSGNWTLGILDFAPPDAGSLVNWTLTLTYSYPVGQPYTGVWSPATGLFTDAGATIPYVAGSQADSVWVVTSTTMDYTVTVATPTCAADPVVIPVTVNEPLTTVTAPENTSGCEGGTATFTVTPQTGTAVTYQWQVSTDGGVTFTDISGATSSTLTVSNIPATANNNQYQAVLSVPGCNSVTSGAATLTVTANPTISITAAPYTSIFPGLTTTLTATLTPPSSTATYQWFLNGDTIPGATSSTYVVGIDGLGDYTVLANNTGTCSAVSNDAITITDSLNTNIFIYPNPNSGVFQVRYHDQLNGLSNGRVITVYDSKGSRVFTRRYTITVPFGRMDVDLSKQPKGVYVVELTDASGNRLRAERVIIF